MSWSPRVGNERRPRHPAHHLLWRFLFFLLIFSCTHFTYTFRQKSYVFSVMDTKLFPIISHSLSIIRNGKRANDLVPFPTSSSRTSPGISVALATHLSVGSRNSEYTRYMWYRLLYSCPGVHASAMNADPDIQHTIFLWRFLFFLLIFSCTTRGLSLGLR